MTKQDTLPPLDLPTGAVMNGRTHIDRLEATGLECEAGTLSNCADWHELKRCFGFLAEWVDRAALAAQAPQFTPSFANGALTAVQQHEIWESSAADRPDMPWQANLAWQLARFSSNLMGAVVKDSLTAQAPQQAQGVEHYSDLEELTLGRIYRVVALERPWITRDDFEAVYRAQLAAPQAAPAPSDDTAVLRRDLAKAHDSANGFIDEIKMLKQEVRELQAFRAMANRYKPEFPADVDGPRDVWYWQGDHMDHLESMVHTLPVVIRAEQLRELLSKATPAPQALTFAQMWELWNSQGSDEMNQQEAFLFARAIERAHGIGASAGGEGC